MFMTVVFIALMLLLILCGGAALHMGLFKGHRPNAGFGRKVAGGILSYGISAVIWLWIYSYHYLGW
jgi:hypothetical protein